MQRFLIAVALVIPACASSTTNTAPATPASHGHMSSKDEDRRVTHPESDVTCQDEAPTGTAIDRRICRSQAEKDHDQQFAREVILNPASRANCNSDSGGATCGVPLVQRNPVFSAKP